MSLYSVVMINFDICDPDFRASYIGAPARSIEEARELVAAHNYWNSELEGIDEMAELLENSGFATINSVDRNTGEVHCEFIVTSVF